MDDIEGTRSKPQPKQISKNYSSLRNDDIPGSKPNLGLYYDNKHTRTSSSLRTNDIEGASSNHYYDRFSRKSPRNPLEPFEHHSPLGEKGKCELKYFGPKPKNKFLRDGMNIHDIPGATKTDRYTQIATRDRFLRSDDIPGATVKVYHKYYYDKEGYMGPKDPKR